MLRAAKKGTSTISSYILKIKKCIDALIVIGETVTDNEHIDAILDGLPNEYDNFIMNVTMRTEPYIVAEIENDLTSILGLFNVWDVWKI